MTTTASQTSAQAGLETNNTADAQQQRFQSQIGPEPPSAIPIPTDFPDTMTTFNSNSTSSSSESSRKFKLDESDKRDIIVYKLRGNYEISSQHDLCKELGKAPHRFRLSRKPIPRGSGRVDVQNVDLFNEPEKTKYGELPNAHSSLASLGLPKSVYWRRLLLGHFTELYIVSPEGSPASSVETTPDGSHDSSPSATFDVNTAR